MSFRDKYYRDMESRAARAYAGHHIVKDYGDGRWVLKSKYDDGIWERNMSVEIICTHHQHVLITGDGPSAAFGYGPKDVLRRISWMAGKPHVCEYVLEKASIGMGYEEAREWNSEVASSEVVELIEDQDREELSQEAIGILQGSIPYTESGRDLWLDSVYRGWPEEDCHDLLNEVISQFGYVPNAGVFYGHAALRRLHALLTSI